MHGFSAMTSEGNYNTANNTMQWTLKSKYLHETKYWTSNPHTCTLTNTEASKNST
jgi:hypothetical protein